MEAKLEEPCTACKHTKPLLCQREWLRYSVQEATKLSIQKLKTGIELEPDSLGKYLRIHLQAQVNLFMSLKACI